MQTAPDYVLYYLPKCKAAAELLYKFSKVPLTNVHLQNILLLGASKPQAINGSPIVVETKMGTLYRGTDAIILMNKLFKLYSDTSLRLAPLHTSVPAQASAPASAPAPLPAPATALKPVSEREPPPSTTHMRFPDPPINDKVSRQADINIDDYMKKRSERQYAGRGGPPAV